MLVRLLGPIEAADEALSLRVPGLRCKTLLALLAIQPGAMVSTDKLIDEIWGARPPPTAMNSLANAVMRVRKVVGPERIVTGQGSYGLTAGLDMEVDLSHFESLVTRASDASLDERLSVLDEALRLWRGEVFGGAQSTPLIDDARHRIEGLRYDAQLSLYEARLAAGQPVKPASVRPLVTGQPGNERAWAALGRSIFQGGDTGLALETVRLASDSLLERGLAPGPDLQAAEHQFLTGSPNPGPIDGPPAAKQPTLTAPSAAAPTGRLTAQPAGERSPGGLVGRRAEIETIQAMVAKAEAGSATLTLVVGEAGIGKTTLVKDLLPGASDPEMRWIFAHCTSGGRGPTIELSLDLGVDVEQAWSGEVLPLIVDRLRTVSKQRPLVVVIEDIHSTLGVSALVSELAAGVQGHRVAIIATGRPGRNTDLLRQNMRGGTSTVVELDGLSADDFSKLVDDLSPDDLERLVSETGGNPLYLLTRTESSVGQTDLSNYVRSELSRLSPESRRIADLLSLHELPLTLGALAAASGITEGLATHLQPLFESGLLVEWTDRTVQVQIRHQLISETVVALLSGSEILELHRAVRDAIIGAGTGDPANLFLAAHHAWNASRSGDADDTSIAAVLCESAGDAAQAHGEWAQAADFYRRALDSGAIDDETRSGRCRLGHAVALFRLGSTDAPGAFLDAARHASVRVDTTLLADVALEWDRGTFSQATKVNDDRIRIVKKALRNTGIDRSRRARLLAGYASELTFAGRSSDRFAIAEEALGLAEECDLPTLAHVLSHRQLTIACLDATDERVKTADAFLDVATELKDPHLLFQANFQRTGPAAIAGDLTLLDDLLDEADDFAQHLSVKLYQWLVCHSKSGLRLLQGDVDGARVLSQRAFDLARGSHQRGEATMIFAEQSCHLARVTGELANLVPGLTQMPGGAEDGFTIAALLAAAAELEAAAAVVPTDESAVIANLPRNFMERPTLQNLAILADALDRPGLGEVVAEPLERRPRDLGITGVAHPCGHHFAALALRPGGDWDRVFAHHVSAVNLHEDAQHPLLSLEAKRELVRSLRKAGAESVDRFRADVLTAEVNAQADELQVGGLRLA